MPIREQPYDDNSCEAFFGGLLPESEIARKAIGKRYGVSHHNTFALLKAIGYDCAGAISLHEIDSPIPIQNSFPLTGIPVSEATLYKHIKELPQKPLFLGWEGLRLSLAGVHDKAAVCLIDNEIFLPTDGCPTSHILKPDTTAFAGMVENEYFCLKLAAQIGLSVPAIEICHCKDVKYLLIQRYDRSIKNQQIERIHQEDFCQAQGIPSSKKYQNEGGPDFKVCFALLNHVTKPAIERNLLVTALVYNFLIGNRDAHGKNFSLLHVNPQQIQLTPFYDIVCTQAYTDLTKKMAMKIGSQYEPARVLPRHWEQLCHEIGYAYPALKKIINKQSEILMRAALQEREHLTDLKCNINMIETIIRCLEKNIEQTLKKFIY